MSDFLRVEQLSKAFSIRGNFGRKARSLMAVRQVSLTLQQGETLGIVGESGCGKSTLGKLLLRLIEADSGSVFLKGTDLLTLPRKKLRAQRRQMQMVFQDPYASLNPRMSVGQILSEPFIIHKMASGDRLKNKVLELMETVGLSPDTYHRYPHEFSGGQRQRIGIARALAVRPELIIADEPVSALDLSIQAQVINLLQDIQQQFNLTMILIAHDLAVVEHISDRIAVMYLGRFVEVGPASTLIEAPRHPYTESLLNAVPIPNPQQRTVTAPLKGEVPSPIAPPSGCAFHPRCPYAEVLCAQQRPELARVTSDHFTACHYYQKMSSWGS